VGPDHEVFSMHMALLCNAAPYFKAAFMENFVEATNGILELPDEKPQMFKYLQLWIYSGNILASHESVESVSWHVLFDLWIFGDARGIPDLQNAVIDVLINKQSIQNQLPNPNLNEIYEKTPVEAPMRRLLVDWFSFCPNLADQQWFKEEYRYKNPKSFLFDLLISYHGRTTGIKARITDFQAVRSDYYVEALDETPNGQDGVKKAEVRH